MATGQDVPTGLVFGFGADGSIDDPSSLRVALLDLMMRIAPEKAVTLGKELLAITRSQDEWAAALRAASLLFDPFESPRSKDADFLVSQVRRRLAEADWLSKPSAGFLSAFDAATFLSDPSIYADMGQLHTYTRASPAVRSAASLALREAAQNDPYGFVSYVLSQPDFLSAAPALRGQLLASADVRRQEMRVGLIQYFQTSQLPREELMAFISHFPQTAWTSGVRLLSGAARPAIPAAEKPEQYAGALEVLDAIRALPGSTVGELQVLLSNRRKTTEQRLAQARAGLSE